MDHDAPGLPPSWGWCVATVRAVDDTCQRARHAEIIDVGLIESKLTRGAYPPTRRRSRAGLIEISRELKFLARRLKLGHLLDNLPGRLAPARSKRLPHHDFLERCCRPDEVARPRPQIRITAGQSSGFGEAGPLRPDSTVLRIIGLTDKRSFPKEFLGASPDCPASIRCSWRGESIDVLDAPM